MFSNWLLKSYVYCYSLCEENQQRLTDDKRRGDSAICCSLTVYTCQSFIRVTAPPSVWKGQFWKAPHFLNGMSEAHRSPSRIQCPEAVSDLWWVSEMCWLKAQNVAVKRVWWEEKGLERETPKEVGGHYRVPGMGQGLRQKNWSKRTDLRNSTERKQTWGDMRFREWRSKTANACQWITCCATRLILIKLQFDHSLTLACFGFILRPHTRRSVIR